MKFIVLLSFFVLVSSRLYAQSGTNIFKDSILQIKEDSLKRIELIVRKESQKKFLENTVAFGGTIGTPGGLNFIAEGYYDRFGIRLAAGACPLVLAFTDGYQADISFVLARHTHSLFEFSIIYFQNYLISIDDPARWTTGFGIGFSGDADGFFFEVGAGHTRSVDVYGNKDSVHGLVNSWPMIFQIGYVH